MTQPCQLPVMFDPNSGAIFSGGAFIKVSGKYPVIITGAQMKATKGNSAAHYLEFTLEITSGELSGQTFIDRLNINNPSDTTREMAFKSLTSYATAIGQQQAFADANILVRRPFQLYVEATEEVSTSDPNKTQWANSVKKWFYADGEDIQQGKFGAVAAQGTPPAQQGYGAPQAAPAAPAPQQAQYAPPQQPQQPQQQPAQQQYAAPTNPAPQQQAPAAGQVTIQGGYVPPQQPAQQQYAAPQGAPAQGGYVPPAAPSFQAPQ